MQQPNVFHLVSNRYWGGPEEYAYGLLSRLIHDNRFYAEAVCKKNEPVLQHFRRLDVPISILPLKGITDIDSAKRLARLLRKGQSIIHVHTTTDAILAIAARRMSRNKDNIKIVLTLHGLVRPHSNYFYKRTYRAINHLVFVSERARTEWIAGAPWANPEKASVIRDSVTDNPHALPAPILRQQLGIPDSQVILMYHGRVSREKGIETLLRAVTQLNKEQFHLVIIGEGTNKFTAEIKSFIIENQLVRNVTLLGFKENIAQLTAQADIGVLPSIEPEALGLSNLEYMRAGKAHITTNNGAQTEYATDGRNALLVDPANHFSLAAAIQRLIDDPQLRNRIGEQAKNDFQSDLNYDIFYTKMTDLYLHLLQQKTEQQ